MSTKIRFATHINSVPYFIHTASNQENDVDIKRFITSETYKLYVAKNFLDRKKIEVTSIDVAETENNKFNVVLNIEGKEPITAVVEYFKFNTGNKGGMSKWLMKLLKELNK